MSARTISMDDRLYDYLLSVSVPEPEVLARLREFNAKLHVDGRVTISLVPIGDGLTLALKR